MPAQRTHRRHIAELKCLIKALVASGNRLDLALFEMTKDRDHYRKIFHDRMLWWPEMLSAGQVPDMKAMIKADMKLLTWCEKANLQ